MGLIRTCTWTILVLLITTEYTTVTIASKLDEVRYVVKSTYDELFEDGKQAYAQKDWLQVVNSLERALVDYNAEKSGMAGCYVGCQSNKSLPKLDDASTEKDIIRHLAAQAVCVEACKRQTMGLRGPVKKSIREQFDYVYPLHYLQYAYFQVRLQNG